MIESVTKQLNIMIKKQLLFILAVTTFGCNTAHSQSQLVDLCKEKEKEIFLSLTVLKI
jgi:hypothetical protein